MVRSFFFSLAIVFASSPSAATEVPDTLLVNGIVVTLTGPGNETIADALAITGGRTVYERSVS